MITSPDPFVHPRISPNYLSTDYDRTHPARTTDGSVFFWSRSSRSGCDDVMDPFPLRGCFSLGKQPRF